MKFFPIRIFTVLQATEAIDLYKSVGFVSEDLTRKIEQGFGKRSNNVEMHMNNQISKWRPDIRNPISSESSEITSFRTNFTKQLDDLAKNVDREIANTEAAVKEIKEALKRSIGKFNWSSEKSSKGAAWENETYYNAGYVNTDEDDKYSSLRNMTISNMQQDKCFANGEIDVSFDQSAVHVPFNVYSLSTEVVRGATYTKELDQNFYQNIRKGRVSSWQYFASSSGFTRFYPTPQWKRKDEFDRPIDYDARFEHWYIGTINYPKEVVIALDASGSMKGYRQILATLTIRNIIESLTSKDYFTIISYNDQARFVHPCYENKLFRATDKVKAEFAVRLQKVETTGVANFTSALETGYKVLKNSNRPVSTSRAMLFVTDGVLSQDLARFNEVKKSIGMMEVEMHNIRIFTYLIGKDIKYASRLKKIACTHCGYFSHVASPADVKENVMKFYHVMNRQLANAKNSYYQAMDLILFKANFSKLIKIRHLAPKWSEVYSKTSIGGVDVQDMILSSTVGIYKTDVEKPDITRLFGVAGVDLPLWKISRHFKAMNMAPNSRQFLLNKSGFVIIHPFLQDTIDEVTVRRSYRSMSLHQLEYISDPNWVQDFRLILHKISRKNYLEFKNVPVKMPLDCVGSPTCDRRDPECYYDHCKRFLFSQTTFQFQKISGGFIVGQAIPSEHANTNIGLSRKFRSDKTSFVGGNTCNSNYRTRTPRQDYLCELLRELRNANQISLPNQWRYCSRKKTATRRDDCRDFTQKEALTEYLTERNLRFECEENMIDALLYDVKITSSLINIWSDVFRDQNDNARLMIDFGFCLTRSGLIRFLDNSPQGQQKSITALDDYGRFSKSGYPLYYQKTVGYPSKTYIFTMSPISDSFLMTRAHYVGENSKIQENEYAPMMITGFQVKNKYLLGMIREKLNHRQIFDAVGGSPCGDWNKPNEQCSGGYRCFVIDDFGYVYLSSRATDEVGKHLGTVDPTLFETMITDPPKLFQKFEFRNYQSTSRQNQTNSPILLDLEDQINSDFHIDRSCIKDYTIYQFNRRSDTSSDYTTVCPGPSKLPGDPIDQCYERKFALRPIFSTNLLMLWVQCCDTGDETVEGPNNGVRNNCIEPRNFTQTLKAQEVAESEEQFCELAQDQAEDLQSTEMIDNIEKVESVSFAKQLGCSGCAFQVINLSIFFLLLLHCLN